MADLAERGDYAVSYDLMSGYYHVGLFHESRKYVGLKWGGKFYVYNCLPFGLSTAPWVFLKVMRELAMHWRRGASECSTTWMILCLWSTAFGSVSGWRAGWKRTSS
jgi:hypothetical protein